MVLLYSESKARRLSNAMMICGFIDTAAIEAATRLGRGETSKKIGKKLGVRPFVVEMMGDLGRTLPRGSRIIKKTRKRTRRKRVRRKR